MITYAVDNEPPVTPPLTLRYNAFSASNLPGQGSNSAHVGYSLELVYLDGGTSVTFGVSDSDVGQGVPWDDDAGVVTDGRVKGWAIDVGSAGSPTHRITLTFATPVHGFKLGITDLDFTSEFVQLAAFSTGAGGEALVMTDHLLNNPTSVPELARGVSHAGNDAYVIDQTKVGALGGGRYAPALSGGTNDRNGTVLFVFGDTQPVQRLELTYTGAGTGVWLAGPTYAGLCGP
jgi:hypothetical protein